MSSYISSHILLSTLAERYTSIGRPSALSYDRLLCTVLHHLKDRCSLPLWAYPILAREMERIITAELFFRREAIASGIQINKTALPRNDFQCVCEKVELVFDVG